jgi:hypothetical protein
MELVLAMVVTASVARTGIQPDPWVQIATAVGHADLVIIELDRSVSVQGGYVSSDDTGIVIWRDGRDLRLSRPDVVRVIKMTQQHRHGKLAGALIGGALAGALLASGEDLNAGGRLMFTGIGVAVGAGIGWTADRYRSRDVVYQRP